MRSVTSLKQVMNDKRKKEAATGDRVHNSAMRGISSQLDLEKDPKKKEKLLRKKAIIKKMKLR